MKRYLIIIIYYTHGKRLNEIKYITIRAWTKANAYEYDITTLQCIYL